MSLSTIYENIRRSTSDRPRSTEPYRPEGTGESAVPALPLVDQPAVLPGKGDTVEDVTTDDRTAEKTPAIYPHPVAVTFLIAMPRSSAISPLAPLDQALPQVDLGTTVPIALLPSLHVPQLEFESWWDVASAYTSSSVEASFIADLVNSGLSGSQLRQRVLERERQLARARDRQRERDRIAAISGFGRFLNRDATNNHGPGTLPTQQAGAGRGRGDTRVYMRSGRGGAGRMLITR